MFNQFTGNTGSTKLVFLIGPPFGFIKKVLLNSYGVLRGAVFVIYMFIYTKRGQTAKMAKHKNYNENLFWVWFLVSGLWFVVSGFWFLVPGFWFVVCCFWFLVSGFWFLASGFWFLVSGFCFCFLVSGFWFLVSGLWLLVSGFWFLVCGFWFLVSGFWFLASCLLLLLFWCGLLRARVNLKV